METPHRQNTNCFMLLDTILSDKARMRKLEDAFTALERSAEPF